MMGTRIPLPLTPSVFFDVISSLCCSYERISIEEWFRKGNQTSPITNAPLASQRLVENVDMRRRAREWRRMNSKA